MKNWENKLRNKISLKSKEKRADLSEIEDVTYYLSESYQNYIILMQDFDEFDIFLSYEEMVGKTHTIKKNEKGVF